MSRRGWIWLTVALLAVPVIVCGWLVGVPLAQVLLDLNRNSHARGYLDQVHAHQGYQRIGTGSEGNCNCNLIYYYVGPAGVDPAKVFTGPNLTLKPWPPVGDTKPWDYLLNGTGDSKQSGVCMVDINRYQHDYGPYDDWNLSDRQRADFKAGKLDILALYAGCASDGL